MRKLAFALLGLIALLSAPASWASLTLVPGANNAGNPPASYTFTTTIGSGQVIGVCLTTFAVGAIPALTISDNVNSGNYSLMTSYATGGLAIYWIKTNASGTPTVSITGTNNYTDATFFAITGFTGTPTADTAIVATNTGTSSTETQNATSGFANETMLICQTTNNQSVTVTVGGTTWTPAVSGNYAQSAFVQIEAIPTTDNFSATLQASATWYTLLGGVYDGGAAFTPRPVDSNGKLLISNGKIVTGG